MAAWVPYWSLIREQSDPHGNRIALTRIGWECVAVIRT
jgi:hypothetical protein